MVYSDAEPACGALARHGAANHGVGEYVRGQVSVNGMESWSMLKRGYVAVFHRMAGAPARLRPGVRVEGLVQRHSQKFWCAVLASR